jgi:mannose-6-phosphate isomerase-like protein (cupin superfamily)
MRKFLLLALPLAALAADPAGFGLWKAADLKSVEKKKLDAQKISGMPLASYGNHSLSESHREGPGIAELHEKVVDIFVVQNGDATLLVGGSIPGAKTTAAGESRGPKVVGGTSHKLAAGDVVHIPANTPHQLLVEPGRQFTYFVVKVNQ